MKENREMTDRDRSAAEWRIDNLYRINSMREGKNIKFKRNPYQLRLWQNLLTNGTAKKDDLQEGFSTLLAVLMVDTCVFHSNISCSIIDLTLFDATKKHVKIMEIYNSLPDNIKKENPMISSSLSKTEWKNGSTITAGTTIKGRPLDILHISNIKKVLSKAPELARDIENITSYILKAEGWVASE